MSVNENLRDAITSAIDAYNRDVEPHLMTGDIIDTCTEIADRLEKVLVKQNALDNPWENGKVLQFPQ